ncbi:outer membrane beta-barrel protein [Burkholderiaceae bacterium DAT-1]|nr:outer membrane beta-barrel protein [Burkholderiaceae bacterium DAT-1]
MKIGLIGMAFIATLGTSAFAQDMYVGGDVVRSTFLDQRGGLEASHESWGWMLRGGMQITDRYELELGHRDFGKGAVDTSIELGNVRAQAHISQTAESNEVSIIRAFNFKHKGDLFLRLGASQVKYERETSGYTSVNGQVLQAALSESDRRTRFVYGIGGRFKVDDNSIIRVEYSKIGNVSPSLSLSSLNIGYEYHF